MVPWCLVFLCTLSARAWAQDCCFTVIDALTNQPVPFVPVRLPDGTAILGDLDGNVCLSDSSTDSLTTRVLGYEPLTFSAHQACIQRHVFLKPSQNELKEVEVLPGVNPAHRIIKACVAQAAINDPEQHVPYSVHVYNKFVAEIDPDSAFRADAGKDSSRNQMIRFFDEQYLFLMESVTERLHIPPNLTRENVLANRVSGLSNPSFAMLATQLQSFTFYREQITVGDKTYVNPLSKGSTKRYLFILSDTLYEPSGDTVFLIRFRPFKHTNFEGLKGEMYVSSDGYALRNINTEPHHHSATYSLRIQQEYEKVDGQWFPSALKTWIVFDNIAAGSQPLTAWSTSSFRNITINASLKKADLGSVLLHIEGGSMPENDTMWDSYRSQPLTAKEQRTYHVIDSIGQRSGLDQIARLTEMVSNGYVPLWVFNVDLDRILDFNDYEGFRLGFGMHTNQKISKYFSVGGYAAYGFKDRDWKYGGKLRLMINREAEANITAQYIRDVRGSGWVWFPAQTDDWLSPATFQEFFTNRMDRINRIEITAGTRFLRSLYATMLTSQTRYNSFQPYYYREIMKDDTLLVQNLTVGEVGIGLRFAPGERFVQTPISRVATRGKGPVIVASYRRALSGFLDGQFDYHRVDMQLQYTRKWKVVGKSTIFTMGGWVNRPLPYSLLYNAWASYDPFSISTPFAFETMRVNEFLSGRYIMAVGMHEFGKSIFGRGKFRPEPAISIKALIGQLEQQENHKEVAFKVPELGYYEAGIALNSIIKSSFLGIGLGVYYRFGPYTLSRNIENLSVKFTLTYAVD